MINAILRLRRDNDYNYAKIKDTFIPANGEICLVDTAREGLRAVCGDGVSTFGQLSYLNDLIQKGYLKDGVFYESLNYDKQLEAYATRIYIDLNKSALYHFNGQAYEELSAHLPVASSAEAGILKLYDTTGQNVDGTMTQKAITDELNEKVEAEIIEEEEMIIFSL